MLASHRFTPDVTPFFALSNLAGKKCLVRTNDSSFLNRCIENSLDGTAPAHFRLTVIVDPSLQSYESDPVFRAMEHFVFASFGNDFFGFDVFRREITAVVGLQRARDRHFWNSVLFPIAMGVMCSVIGVVPMHCACLEWEGEGVLIAGVSGAGKSTLSAAMA